MKAFKPAALILVVMATLLVCSVAWPQSLADRTTARRLAHEGQQALLDKDFETAEDRFSRASNLVDAPTLLVGLARAHTGRQKFVEAYEIYQQVIRAGSAPGSPAAFKRAVADAEKEIAEVEPRLAWLTIRVNGVESGVALTVTINDTALPDAAVGVERPVNPGNLTIRAKAEGYESAQTSVEVSEGERDIVAEVELEKLPDPEEAGPPPVDMGDTGPDDEEKARKFKRTLSYAALGAGAAGVLTGAVTGFLALNKKSALDDDCIDVGGGGLVCSDASQGDLDSYRTMGTVSTIGFIAGGVLAGAGVYLWLTSREPEEQAAGVRAYVGLGSVGLTGSFQ